MIINFKCFITVSLLKRLEMKTQRLPQPLYTKSFHLQIKCYKPKKKKKKTSNNKLHLNCISVTLL